MFFMKPKFKYSKLERDEMIAFISKPSKSSSQAQDVKLIRAVERRGMGVPCPAPIIAVNPIMDLMFHSRTLPR